ncbi:hypothetical protein Barb6XT_01985 [Bacteroidales bacterium Barb6XT]|nr:hypothetical protein Barb6XT_01985 [Bacteroidales bacterium Barb6XT]
MKKLVSLLVLCVCVLPLAAQLKTYPNGKIGIGSNLPSSSSGYNAQLSIYGPGSFGNGGRLQFGSLATSIEGTAPAMFIGDYSNPEGTSSPHKEQLWLHSIYGLHVSVGTGIYGYETTIIDYHWYDATNKFKIKKPVYAPAFVEETNPQLRENVKKLSKPLSLLSNVNAVSYTERYVSPFTKGGIQDDKKEEAAELERKLQIEAVKTKIGLDAEALQKVYPELVELNNEGNYEINYTGLVPVLLEGIKELQSTLAEYKQVVTQQFASLEPRLIKTQPSIKDALVTFTEEGANRNENKRGVLKVSNKVSGLKVSVDLSNDPNFGSLLYHTESSDSEISVPLDEYKAQYLRASSSRYDLRIMAEASRTIWYADANGDKQSIDK